MRYTITDIAKLANVSKATVSRVINNKTEGVSQETSERIRAIIEEVGYRPNTLARSVAVQESMTLGLIIPDIANPFFPELVRGIEDYAEACGYTVFLCNSDNDPVKEEKYLMTFIDRRVDGIILASANSSSDVLARLSRYNVPFVLVDRPLSNVTQYAGVYADNYQGFYMSTEYFIKQGNKRIAFLGGPRTVVATRERFSGYRDAHRDANLHLDGALIKYDDFSIAGGERMMRELVDSRTEFEAVVAGSDLTAIGAMRTLHRHGIEVPNQCEVIDFDGIQLGDLMEPALSTVAQPIYEIGSSATRLLIEKLQGKLSTPRRLIFDPTLELKGTTKGDQPPISTRW